MFNRRVNLKEFRRKKRLTQKELADSLGYSLNAYSRIELGSRDGSLEFWSKFQEVYNVPDKDMWKIIKKESPSNEN